MENFYQNLSQVLVLGDKKNLLELSKKSLNEGVNAIDLLNKGLIPGMEVVGDRMKSGEMFIPEVLRSARAMQAVLDMLTPLLSEADLTGLGAYVIGTVEGDLHDIGKNLLGTLLLSSGFEVIDLGMDIKAETIVEEVKKTGATIVGLSSLLTMTVDQITAVHEALKAAGLRDKVKLIVGGAPLNLDLAKRLGADDFADDAVEGVRHIKELAES